MFLIKQISELPQTGKPVVLAMGCFDGVHVGHQKVISTAVEQAAARGGEAWVYTFNPHPAKVLVPEKAPPLISAEPCRLRQMKALGVAGVIETPFTREFASLPPETFLSNLCADAPTLSGIVCGQDWSFGYRASGTFQTLETFGQQHGFTATAVAPVMDGDRKISSTTIRNAVSEGNIPLAEKLLGRPFSLFGTVVKGHGIGRGLGFPTANIEPLNELIPAPGIYAAYTLLQETENGGQKTEDGSSVIGHPSSVLHPSAVFIGERKTFNDTTPVIESYLLDFDRDLYGQLLEVCLVEKTRDVHPFPTQETLIEQIKIDVAQIRTLLAADHKA